MENSSPKSAHEKEVSVYRVYLKKLKIVDELGGFTEAGLEQSPYDDQMASAGYTPSPEQTPYHSVFITGLAENSCDPYRKIQYKGRSISFNGVDITILSSKENFPDSKVSILDVVFDKKPGIFIYINETFFNEFVCNLRTQKPQEIELYFEISLDSLDSPENIYINVKKIWLRSFLNKEKIVFNYIKLRIANVFGMILGIAFGIIIYQMVKYFI